MIHIEEEAAQQRHTWPCNNTSEGSSVLGGRAHSKFLSGLLGGWVYGRMNECKGGQRVQ